MLHYVVFYVASTGTARPYVAGYSLSEEAKGTYGGYPRWAIAIFGWILCVILPLSLIVLGMVKPLHLLRPKEEDGFGLSGGLASTELTALSTTISSDDYRDEEDREDGDQL
jgi:hypothetical protein